jgi:RNA polymerase sigma factor (sigma-70 family)
MENLKFYDELLKNENYLKNVALKFTRNLQDAADLHQETLCKALECRNSYRDGIALAPWLYVIIRNTFINMYHRKKNIKDYLSKL